jgi:hypothetical protein
MRVTVLTAVLWAMTTGCGGGTTGNPDGSPGDVALDAAAADATADGGADVGGDGGAAGGGGEGGVTDWSDCGDGAKPGVSGWDYCLHVQPCYVPVQLSVCVFGYDQRPPATRACLAYYLCRARLPATGDAAASSNLDQFCPAVRGEGADTCRLRDHDGGTAAN